MTVDDTRRYKPGANKRPRGWHRGRRQHAPWLAAVGRIDSARCGADNDVEHLRDLGVSWPDGLNIYEQAKFMARHRERYRPIMGCHCGLYALPKLAEVGSGSGVSGMVLLTGRIIEHEHKDTISGWRAERARILALVHRQPDRLRQALHPDYGPIPVVATVKELQPIHERWSD